jgi:hypothetical protein
MKNIHILPKEELKQVCENCKIEISKYGCACGTQIKEETEQEQDKKMYNEEELKNAFKVGFNIGYGSQAQELDFKNYYYDKWFKQQFKNK